MTESLTIVLPVYNEGDNIVQTLREIEANVRIPHASLIVYDFDEDNTLPAMEKYIRETGAGDIRLVKNTYGRGVLNAIKTGFNTAGEDDIVLVTMADLSDNLDVVGDMFEKMRQGYDVVCGSRYMKGGRHVGGPRLKKLLSRLAGLSLHLMTGIQTHDISNSFKMYRNSVVRGIDIESRGGFEVGMEIVVKAYLKGYKITEVPSIWRDRVAGESRFKLARWLPEYLRWYMYAVKGSVRKVFKVGK